MTKNQSVLGPGFLMLPRTQAVIFFVPPDRIKTLPAMLLIAQIIEKNFDIASTFVLLHNPRKILPELSMEDVKAWCEMFQGEGRTRQTAVYVNAQDCNWSTIHFTEGLAIKTLYLDLDDKLPSTEDIARKALVQILKAVQ